MHFYKPRKKFFCVNVISISCIVIISSYLWIKFIPFSIAKYSMPILVSIVSLWSFFLLAQDYQNGLTVTPKGIRTVSRGSTFDISYQDIFSISYHGFAGFPFWDCLVLNCGKGQKIYIDAAAYHEYPVIWAQIILYAKVEKPNVVVDPRVTKRLNQDLHK